jgi:ATP-dependent Lhr-like helicase
MGPPAGAGRWSLVAPLLDPPASATEVAHGSALQLLERHGVLTREAVLSEGLVGGFTSVYGVLKVLEERGQVRRGYFVAGLGAAQFALPGAVDRLRASRDEAEHGAPIVLAATDPAQPYGAALPWPDSEGRPARAGGALVATVAGRLLVWLDRRGHHLVTFPGTAEDGRWADALVELVKDGRFRSLEIRKVDGRLIAEAPAIAALLRAAGFVEGYRGLVYRA